MDEFLQAVTESYVFNTRDLGFRLDHWNTNRHDGDSNILLITGHSGSGKTTLARQLGQKYGAGVISFDWFDFYADRPCLPESPEYAMWKLYTDCVRKANKSGFDPKRLKYKQRQDIFTAAFINLREKCNPSNLYICEGIQIINLLPLIIPSRLPLICKGTSAAVSAMRRMDRDGHIRDTDGSGKDMGRIKAIIEWMGIEKINRRFMAQMNATGAAVPVNL